MPSAPRAMARVNKHFTNRLLGLWAPYLPPWASLKHVGRRSGRRYATPVVAVLGRDRLVVPVLYGERSDWVLNVLAAEGGEITRAGRSRRFAAPRLRDAAGEPGSLAAILSRVSGRVLEADLI
jgi:deazaflavin-dependent oxidoreductase (nitroreductase family)